MFLSVRDSQDAVAQSVAHRAICASLDGRSVKLCYPGSLPEQIYPVINEH